MRELMNATIGWENVRLLLQEESGGSFTMAPDDNSTAKIVIGKSTDEGMAECLLHEVIEFTMTRMGLRYAPSPEQTSSHDSYIFYMTHPQLSEATARAIPFLVKALAALKEE